MRRRMARFLFRFRLGLPALRRHLQDECGGAFIEVALIVSILGLPLILGSVHIGTVLYDSIEIENAAHAGALYGMQGDCCTLQTAQMIVAAQNEASDLGANLAVTPTSYYACSAAQAGPVWTSMSGIIDATSLATAKTNCTGANGHVLAFVKVVASAPVPLPFHCCGLPTSITVTRASVMESEQLP